MKCFCETDNFALKSINFRQFFLLFRISMVEQPDPAEFKARNRMLSSNVKLRMPGNRSKKNDASRNSRAFALQLKQLSEGSSSPPVMRTPSPNISSRHFGRTSSAKNTSPLKAVPLQNLANINSDLSGSLTHLHEKNSRKVSTTSEKLYNTVSGATGRHLSQESTFFQDEYISSTRNVTRQEYGQFQGSTWSLKYVSTSQLNIIFQIDTFKIMRFSDNFLSSRLYFETS